MKIVVFTQRVELVESYGERRDCADQRIAKFIRACDFLPVPLPNDVNLALSIVETIKPRGIILTGGNSLVEYGGNAPERDETDEELILFSEKNHIPLYGFCRGMQSVLHHYGEKLEEVSDHVAVRHEIFGKISGCVNSFHNQACKALFENSPLEILSKSSDGVIEAARHKNFPIFCTMWHPERENPFCNTDIERIKNFFGGKK